MKDSLVPPATAARVAAKLEEEIAGVERVVGLVGEVLSERPIEPAPPVVTVHGTGGLIHDFYTGVEKLFRQVSPHFNGELPGGEAWHRELLHSMTLDLPRVRPPVIGASSEGQLATYLRFRHVYRNMYGFRLDWERVRELAEGVGPFWLELRGELEAFLAFLDALVQSFPARSGEGDGP